MSEKWETDKLTERTKNNLCDALNRVSSQEQLLIVAPNILPTLNSLISFADLRERTPVEKIVILDDQINSDLSEILSGEQNYTLVFIIDVRLDLHISDHMKKYVTKAHNNLLNIVYCAWPTQVANNLGNSKQNGTEKVSHFIVNQISDLNSTCKVKLIAWEMIPFPTIDCDVLNCNMLFNSKNESMYSPTMVSMKTATKEILIDNMANAVESILKSNNSHITYSVAIGNDSKKLVRLLKERVLRKQTDEEKFVTDTLYANGSNSLQTDLIILERSLDPLTPLLTQLTYAGILDDLYNVTSQGKVEAKELSVSYSKDEIWNELKFLNFGLLGPILNNKAKNLQENYDARHKAESVGEIKQFVSGLGSLQQKQKLLKKHTSLSSEVLEEVEENSSLQFNKLLDLEQDILMNNIDVNRSREEILNLIYEGEVSKNAVLKLLCILSLCQHGLKDKDYTLLKQEVIDSYGIEICFQLEKLSLLGLFTSKSQIAHFQKRHVFPGLEETALHLWQADYRVISKCLNTMPEEDHTKTSNHNENEPKTAHDEATFAYCGVIPTMYRLVQMLYDRSVLNNYFSSQQPFIISRKPDFTGTEKLLEKLYGSGSIIESDSWNNLNKNSVTNVQVDRNMNDLTYLVFLGGITFGEIATLKVLQEKLKRKNINKKFVIICDGFISSSKIIQSYDYSNYK